MKASTNKAVESTTLSLVDLYAKTAELFSSLVDLTSKREEFQTYSAELRAGIIEASDKVVVDTLGFFVIPSTQNVHLDNLFINESGSKKDIQSKRQAYKAGIMAGRELGKHGDRANKLLAFLRERSIALKTPIFEFSDAQFESIKAQHQKADLARRKEADKLKAIETARLAEIEKITTERSLISYDEAYAMAYAEQDAKRAQIVLDAQKELERIAQVNSMLDSGKVDALAKAHKLIDAQDEQDEQDEQDDQPVGHVLQKTPSAPATETVKIAYSATFNDEVMAQADLSMNRIVGAHGVPVAVAMARMILAKYEEMK